MTVRRTVLAAAAVAAVGVAATACTPQETGTVLVEGDSITWTWGMSGGGGGNAHATPGATIDSCPAGWDPDCVPPDDHIVSTLQAGKAATIEVRLGTNDTANGWDAADEAAWSATLQAIWDQSEPDACVVLVLPWLLPPVPAERRAEIDQARWWMFTRGLPWVDWKPYFERPGSAGPDGIHQATDDSGAWPVLTPEAMAAFNDSHTAALDKCQGGN
jgi:hypothetical protein